MSTQTGKDIIYIDIDDEITAIIDKVRGSHERIVALVLPKRSTVMQSIVNMKLLKRTADESKKHLVLITSEVGLLPLAGSVGIYVAKTLQSRPEIPVAPAGAQTEPDDAEEAVSMADDKLDGSQPIGEHAKHAPQSVISPSNTDDDQPIELDNTTPAAAATGDKKSKKGKKKGKKFSIPDFSKFRTWLIIGGAALVITILLLYVALAVLPKATILVKTDSTALQDNIDVTLNTETAEVEPDDGVVPAVAQESQKSASGQADATGQKDKGQKASGSVVASTACTSDAPPAVPAGTAVSAGGLTFITQQNMGFSPQIKGGKCQFVGNSNVVAQQNGEQYNLGARSDYKIASNPGFDVSGSTMAGGTSQIVKVLTQADLDNAKRKLTNQDTEAIKEDLLKALTAKGLYAIEDTFQAGDSNTSASARVGDEVNSVSVTGKVTYSMMGAKQDDLKKLIDNAMKDKIDESKQKILDYGLDSAVFKLMNQQDANTLVSMDVTVIAGSDINLDEIKKQVAGKKSNDAKQIIGAYPSVTDVNVNYSPFWVNSIPKKTSKITITIEKPVAKDAKPQ